VKSFAGVTREYAAESAEHAIEQHVDAFPDTEDGYMDHYIIEVRCDAIDKERL
jgi:hypothetical protein